MANAGNNISVINISTNTVTATVGVGNTPIAFGQFIGNTAPTITWNNPADIVYRTPLSSTQLGATASIPRTFVILNLRNCIKHRYAYIDY